MIRKGRKTQDEPVYTGPSVSELLKTTRERTGQDLQTVAQVLRIRFVYLDAIEAGRYEDLPGKTYVVGFVRAYAEHLGLASEEVVKQFKDEIAGLEGKAELVFPSPVTEQSVPGGAIVLIGLIILAGAYGGWYFLSSQDRSMAELVPDLPAKFAEMVDKVKDSKKDDPQPEETPAEEPVVGTEPVKPAEPVSEADTQDMAQMAREAVEQAEEKAEEVEQVVETVKVEEVAANVSETPEKIEEKVEEVVEEISEKVEESVVETTEAVEEKVQEAVEVSEEATAEVTEAIEEKAEEVATAVSEEAVVEEEESAKPEPMTEKVVLKSVDYAWIQVTDGSGNVVHTQVLNQGEEYQIPPTHGLILRTGNAGGLEIYVDDEKMPALGEAGDVLRKVHLNPEKLKNGSAVEG